MIELILPHQVHSAEAYEDRSGAGLYPSEEKQVSSAVAARRLEFATARDCARRALVSLGQPAVAIGRGQTGDPIWPDGIVGSITHCDGYRAAAVARADSVQAIGIDAEPATSLPPGLHRSIAQPEEIEQIDVLRRGNRHLPWDRLLFSAKEAAYKAWFPEHRETRGFREVLIQIDPESKSFLGSVLSTRGQGGERSYRALPEGRWMITESLILTSVVSLVP
jgi:enterobactin synthetase component D / holo-[acyl-carrier protein] synthase